MALVYLFVFVNLIMCGWSVLNGDIYYYTDIARDFLIFDEIVSKKIVLFGPRADFAGFFHGILWHYINVPAYILGNGNPVVVGWFWILLTIGFITSSYYVAKKLFDKKSGIIMLVLLSCYMVPITQGFFHGNGAMLILPAFFYLFIRYAQKNDPRYLAGHMLLLGFLVQFEIAIGLPLVILSSIASLFLIIRRNNYKHLLCFGFLIVAVASFILIELRYDFTQIRAAIKYLGGTRDQDYVPFAYSLYDRLDKIASRGFNIFRLDLYRWNYFVFAIYLLAFIRIYQKKGKNLIIYASFLYFYVGYYALTLFHGGEMLLFWWLPMSTLPLLMLSSFHHFFSKKIFYGFLGVIITAIMIQNVVYIKTISEERGRGFNSWQFHYNLGKKLVDDAPKEYGYFIYAPDVYGYQDKYAMLYAQRQLNKFGTTFEKKPTTYILIEPPPPDTPGLSPKWWIENKVGIKIAPKKIIKFGLGYEIHRYHLSEVDIQIPSQVSQSDWLYFR